MWSCVCLCLCAIQNHFESRICKRWNWYFDLIHFQSPISRSVSRKHINRIHLMNCNSQSESNYFVSIFLIHRHGHTQNHRASVGRDGAAIRSRHIELQGWRRAVTNYILVQRRRITQSGTRIASHDLTIRRPILLKGTFLLIAHSLTHSPVHVSFTFIVWHEMCHVLRCHPSDWVVMPLNGSYLREH